MIFPVPDKSVDQVGIGRSISNFGLFQVGKLHVGKQDLSKLQSRKMKGLKKNRDVVGEAADDEMLDEEVQLPGRKKART